MNSLRIATITALAAAALPSFAGIIVEQESGGGFARALACDLIAPCISDSENASGAVSAFAAEEDTATAEVRGEVTSMLSSTHIEVRGKGDISVGASPPNFAQGDLDLSYLLTFTVPTTQAWQIHEFFHDEIAPNQMTMFKNDDPVTYFVDLRSDTGFVTLLPGQYVLTATGWASCSTEITVECYPSIRFGLRMDLVPQAVPEPECVTLLSSGLAVLVFVLWRRNRSPRVRGAL